MAHVIMIAKKSANWRPRKAGDVVLNQDLRTRRTDGVNPHPRAVEDCYSRSEVGKRDFSLPPTLCFILTLSSLNDALPHWAEQSAFLSPPIQMLSKVF